MESYRNFTTNAVGFLLLPSELIEHIILRLALPDVVKLKSVCRSISSVIAEQDFVRDYNLHSGTATTWLFVYKKRWRRDSMLHGYTNRSGGWFKIVIADMLKSVVPPGEDLYLLTASGNFFLFALNNSLEVISVNPMSRTVRKIPPSPLGPRGTSSWRRSGMKLLSCPSGADHFRFLFAEMDGDRPILFEYDSRVDRWSSTVAAENDAVSVVKRETDVFLVAYNGRSGSVVIAKATGGEGEGDSAPLVVRPRLEGLGEIGIDRLHVYGDGNLLMIKSKGVVEGNRRVIRMLTGIELWAVGPDGRRWEVVSAVPEGLMEKIRKPYGAMMGCMERRRGAIRAVLMSNLEAVWEIIWLTYDVGSNTWDWIPITDCKMNGANMAGIAFSSGLTL